MSGLKIIDGTPTEISKYLREKEPKLMSENIKLKKLLKDIEEIWFNWNCDCDTCKDIKKRIEELK